MSSEQTLYLQDCEAKRIYLEENAVTISKSPIVKEDVDIFFDLFSTAQRLVKEENDFEAVTGAAKKLMKTKIATNLLNVFEKLGAYAIKTNNEDLKTAAKTKISTFLSAGDDDFSVKTKDALTRFKPFGAVLEKYGLSVDFQNELEADIANYSNVKPTMAIDRSKMAVMTQNRNDAFKKLKEFVDGVLIVAVGTLEKSNPDFVNGYKGILAARLNIVPIKFSVKTINALTSTAEAAVTIAVSELNASFVTDKNGKVTIKTGDINAVTLTITKEGFAPQEVSLTKLRRGSVSEVVVKLESVMKQLL